MYGRCRCTVQFRQLSFCGCRSGYSDSFKSAVPAAGGKDQAHYLQRTYRISVTCQENAETEIRALLINSNSCKTLYLTNLESSDVIGGKVEIQADFLSVGKAKAQMAEAIVNRLLTLSSVVSAGWELV